MGTEPAMKPWEQHSAVISIPRFDYNAPTSLLQHSYSGFLVTCPIKREKSATKEAMSILEKYIGSSSNCKSQRMKSFNEKVATKRSKICIEEAEGKLAEASCLSSVKSDSTTERFHDLSLIKLTRSGLLLFTFHRDSSHDVVDIVSNIIQSLESGCSRSPLWCHRICPIQATCALNEKELWLVVSKLVRQFLNDRGQNLARPITFAVGYNRRGIEETEMKGRRISSSDSDAFPLLDRSKCLAVVAAAVKDAVSEAVVDLNCPELSVLVELLPLSGVPDRSLIVAVSVLPNKVVRTKPRLCVKALVSDMKVRN